MKKEKVVIYGAGLYGTYICTEINKSSHFEVFAFIDNFYYEKNTSEDNGCYPIYTEEHFFLLEGATSYTFLVSVADKWECSRIVVSLVGRGAKSIYVYSNPFLHSFAPVISDEDGEFSRYVKCYSLTVPFFNGRIQYHIVDHCNLNCRGCSSFSNISKPGYVSLDIAQKDIHNLHKVFPYIRTITLYGGEALLHPNIVDIISIVRKSFPDTTINIFSNGIIIPQLKQSILQSLVENQISFIITQYPPTKKMLGNIMDCLEKYHIEYAFEMETDSFFKYFIRDGSSNAYENWRFCRVNHACYTVYEGKIFRCPQAPHLIKERKYLGINMNVEDYSIGIPLNTNLCGWDIWDRLDNKPYPTCRFCNPDSIEWKCEGFLGMKWDSGRNKAQKEDWLI